MRLLFALLIAAAASGTVLARQAGSAAAKDGWAALDAGRPAEAAKAFQEALERAPRDPMLLVGAAIAAHRLGQTDTARTRLLGALEERPQLTPASLLLGEILYSTGDIPGAIAVYEQALAHAPGEGRLTRRLEAWRKEADLHASFNKEFGVHFTVLFEGPAEAEIAARAVEILERAYWRIGAALYAYPPDVITVVLYTREQFRDITESPAWAGGAFDGRIHVPVQSALLNVPEFERVLAHEFTHALVRSVGGRNVPQWLHEGLAQYFEGSDLARKRRLLAGAKSRPALSRLEKSFQDMTGGEARVAYAQSAVAAARLIELAGAEAVVNLLTDLGANVPFAEAFERRIFMPYDEFQRELAGGEP